MADKTVRVVLQAIVSDYQRAMQAASSDTTKLAQGIKSVSGENLKKLGDTLSTRVTLPLVAAGGAAVKMSTDFDSTFSRMVGLAGVSADQVGNLKAQVLGLAGETARAPQDLAEGLYFIESAGLSGQVALDALKVSAKGASAGLGDTATVADAVTSAINAYGSANLSAAKAGDVLAATAKEGKAEAAALAPQFGRLLPVAAQLGISFDQVGAGMAFLSRASGDAALSATQLAGVMNALLRPTQQSQKILDGVGLSFGKIQDELRTKGLLTTLQDLRKQLGETAFTQFFQDVQGLQGALQLTGSGAEEARQVFDNLANSTGTLDNAFSAFADSAGFKQKQAFAELQVALIKVGDTLVPIVNQLMSFVSAGAEAFSSLPGPVQDLVIGFVGLLAAIGPVLSLVGRFKDLRTTLEGMGRAGQVMSSGLGTLATIGGVATVATTVAFGLEQLRDAIISTRKANLGELANELVNFSQNGQVSGEAARILGGDLGHLRQALDQVADPSLGDRVRHVGELIGNIPAVIHAGSGGMTLDDARQTLSDLDSALAQLAATSPDAAKAVVASFADQGISVDQLTGLLPKYRDALANADTQQKITTGGTKKQAGAMEEAALAAQRAADALKAYSDQLRAQFDPLFGMITALQHQRDAQDAAAQAEREHGRQSREYADAAVESTKATLDVHDAAIKLAGAVQNGTVSIDQAKQMLVQWAAEGGITADTAELMGNMFAFASGQADSLEGHNVAVAVSAPGLDQVIAMMDSFLRMVDAVPSGIEVNFGTGSGNVRLRRWGGIDAYAAGGLRSAGITNTVMIGEPATGGEAFIPRLGNRSRSLGILQTAASWYGAQVAPAGALSSAQPVAAGGGTTMVFAPNVRIAPGVFNKGQVGREIAEALVAFSRGAGWGWVGQR